VRAWEVAEIGRGARARVMNLDFEIVTSTGDSDIAPAEANNDGRRRPRTFPAGNRALTTMTSVTPYP
jgi:hypothetical protein